PRDRSYRWFCGLSIEDYIPDHSAFSRACSERFRESDVFRRVFEGVVSPDDGRVVSNFIVQALGEGPLVIYGCLSACARHVPLTTLSPSSGGGGDSIAPTALALAPPRIASLVRRQKEIRLVHVQVELERRSR